MGGARGGKKNKSSKSARRARRDAAVKAKVNANRNPIQSRLQSAGFTQKQLNSLKTQHASFKKHQKEGTLSTHQKKYKTGSYALSGAQRAQQMARDRIAAQKKPTSQSKNWGTNLKDSIVSNWNKFDKALTRPDNYKNLPSFMGDTQVTSADWTRAKDTAVNIGKWGLDRLDATRHSMANAISGGLHRPTAYNFGERYDSTTSDLSKYGGDNFALVGQPDGTYKPVPKSDYNTWAKRLGHSMSNQDSGIIGMTTAAGKGYVDNLVRATTMLPEKGWGSLWGTAQRSRDYLRTSQYKDPTLRAAYDVGSFIPTAQLAQGGVGLVGNIGKLGTKGRLLQSIVPATAKTFRGATLTSGKQLDRGLRIAKGIRDGTYTGSKAQQISSALKSNNLKSLGLQRVYHGTTTDAARKITQGALSGTGKGFRESMGMLGKGAYSSTKRGVAGSYRGNFLKGTPFNTNINLTPGNVLGAGVGAAVTGAKLLGQTNRAYEKAFPEENRTKSLLNLLNTDLGRWAVNKADDNETLSNYFTDKAEVALQPAFEMAGDMKGIKGWWAGRQVKQAQRHLDNQDLSGLLNQATMVSRRYEESEGKIPGTWGLVKGGVGDAWNRFTGRDRQVESVRQGQVLGFDNQRKVDTARQFDNIYSRGGRGRQALQEYDINKIGNTTANEYLESGSAAYDEDMLVDFWNRQNQLNAAADQRLLDIQNDRSIYNTMLQNIQSDSQVYEDELARLQPYGQQYSDELARLQPIGEGYQDELARLQPYDKQYSDELARLQPYGKEFTSSIADLTKGRDELRGYQGKWTHPDDVKFLKEQLPQYDKAISDLQTQYKQYQTDVSDLTAAQTDYQKYLGEVQTGQKDYQKYLSEVQGGQKDYQKYLGEVQTGQKALSDYGASVRSDLGELENYATAFSDARKASDEAARSYTVQSQQGIASGLRQGVAGIRAARGYRTVGSNRNKSAKRRWNRDFRIQSFGEGGGVSPINI